MKTTYCFFASTCQAILVVKGCFLTSVADQGFPFLVYVEKLAQLTAFSPGGLMLICLVLWFACVQDPGNTRRRDKQCSPGACAQTSRKQTKSSSNGEMEHGSEHCRKHCKVSQGKIVGFHPLSTSSLSVPLENRTHRTACGPRRIALCDVATCRPR